jgi:predicted amidohydrolase
MTENNMLPGVDTDQWHSWLQRKEIAPAFEKTLLEDEPVLKITSARFEQYGKWLCDVPGVTGGETYRFYVEYLAENITHETVSLHGLLTWRDKEGKPHTRDYLTKISDAGNGWKSMTRIIDAPEAAASLTVELALKWSDSGTVIWRKPVLQKAEPVRNRLVKVASAFINKIGTLEGNLEQMLLMIDKAGAEKADIVCLGETVYDWGVSLPMEQRAVVIPGPVSNALSDRARKHNMYIVLSLNEKEGDYYYNTGLLIGRNGEIAGKYKKMQLPLCEGEDGITPGQDYPVFDTDFGKIGIMICWDHGFPEVARILTKKGAEILFLPTLWHTDIQAPARAVDNGVYVVVSAPRWTKTPCRVISPEGEVIAAIMGGEYNENGLCTAVINLDKRVYTYWLSVGAAFGEGKSCYMQEPRYDSFGLLVT